MPLIDGARLFTLSQGIKGLTIRIPALNNSLTILNIRNISYCAEAFLILSKLRTVEGLKMKILVNL
jgi:CBS domain-containing protein